MNRLEEESFEAALSRLSTLSSPLAATMERHGKPPFWHRPPGFATLSLFIVEQQVSLASAKAVFERLLDTLGRVSADTVLEAAPSVLAQVGLTRQKQRYLLELAGAVRSGRLDLDGLSEWPDEEVQHHLQAVPGIGRWTADVYLLSALRRPDVWPVGDRALQVGVREILDLDEVPDPDALERIGDTWRPYRSVAARLVWHAYLSSRNRTETEVAGLTPIPSQDGSRDYRSVP
jgi:DNA-3-methyladenine glycosylase II